MATSADPTLLDTSAAIALVRPDQHGHQVALARLARTPLGLAGHAAFETFSVLTRLPPPQRLTANSAARLIAANFPHTRQLSAERAAGLIADLARLEITGGSVYDALVGAVAVEHGLRLVSLDRRAEAVYRALGVDLELL